MTAPLPRSVGALTLSNLAAQCAEQLSLAAVPIVAVLLLGAGPGEIGPLATAQSLPFLLLSIALGLWADRRSRRGMMIWTEGLRAVSLLALLAAVLSAQLSIALLAMLGFVGAVGTVAFSVAAPALVPARVPREQLAAANGRLDLARSMAFAAGPALAGALVSWAGASGAFVLGRCCRARPRCCCCAWLNRYGCWRSDATRCSSCARARGWCGAMPCCGRSCSPP